MANTVEQSSVEKSRLIFGAQGVGRWDSQNDWNGGAGVAFGQARYKEGALTQAHYGTFSWFFPRHDVHVDIGSTSVAPFGTTGAARFFGFNGVSQIGITNNGKSGDEARTSLTLGLGLGLSFILSQKIEEDTDIAFLMLFNVDYSIGLRHSAPGGFDLVHGPLASLVAGMSF